MWWPANFVLQPLRRALQGAAHIRALPRPSRWRCQELWGCSDLLLLVTLAGSWVGGSHEGHNHGLSACPAVRLSVWRKSRIEKSCPRVSRPGGEMPGGPWPSGAGSAQSRKQNEEVALGVHCLLDLQDKPRTYPRAAFSKDGFPHLLNGFLSEWCPVSSHDKIISFFN